MRSGAQELTTSIRIRTSSATSRSFGRSTPPACRIGLRRGWKRIDGGDHPALVSVKAAAPAPAP